ncbi:MAG: calcium-binding protein [Phycisphaerae bacterium]
MISLLSDIMTIGGTLKESNPTMAGTRKDQVREARIENDIVVDAYDASERAMGWYYYLEEKLQFPFTARCIKARPISPLRVGDEVEVLGMAPEDECEHEMFVMIRWEKPGLGIPLSQLKAVATDDSTSQALDDWHYWVKQGYDF